MENENKTTQDCGCDSGCCTPGKSKLWTKILFIAIIVAAIAIITVKLISNNSGSKVKGATIATEKSGCEDSSMTKKCDPEKNSSCCPKQKD